MSQRQRALRCFRLLVLSEWSLRFRRDRIGHRVKWYCYRLGEEGPLCRTPQQAIEAVCR